MGIRIRIQTKPPLPQLKAWFKPEDSDQDCIADLKTDLCSRVEALTSVQSSTIGLYLDGFELLDDSAADLIRDGDLISIQRHSAGASPANLKRKLDSVQETAIPHKKRKHTPVIVAPLVKVDSSDDSSISSSDSSDSSDSSSSSDSDSDSDSDSSSDSSPVAQAIKQTLSLTKPVKRPVAKPQVPLVPPGQGKPSTHSRNVRRRLKRQHAHDEIEPAAVAAPKGSSAANLEPLGAAKVTDERANVDSNHVFGHINGDAPGVMMAALRTKNKNKKRGFRNALTAAVPSRIVFDDNETRTVDPSEVVAAIDVGTGSTFQFPPRLVPPSELYERGQLPSNMFVTVVDVEEGEHVNKTANTKSNKKKNTSQSKEVVDEPTILDYGEKEEAASIPIQRDWTKDADWDYAESIWEQLAQLANIDETKVDAFIACRTLDINPATFTPEFLISIARIVAVSEQTITLTRLSRPGASADAISFGQRKRKQEDYEYAEEEKEEEEEKVEKEPVEDEIWEWNDIVSDGWRALI